MKHLKLYTAYTSDNYNGMLESVHTKKMSKEWFKAIEDYDIETIERLIDSGWDVNIGNEEGETALRIAVYNDFYDDRLVKLLLKQPNIQTEFVLITAAATCHEGQTILLLLCVPDIRISLEGENFIQALKTNMNFSNDNNEDDLSFLNDYNMQKTVIDNKRFDIIKLLDEYDYINPEIKKEFAHLFTGTDLNLL